MGDMPFALYGPDMYQVNFGSFAGWLLEPCLACLAG